MKHIEKKRLSTKYIVSIALAVSLVLFIVLSILITGAIDKDDGGTVTKDPPEIIDGEEIKNGMALAYPEIENKTKITSIMIRGSEDEGSHEFGFIYDDEKYLSHIMYYVDSDGKQQIYLPEICYEDSSINYSSLFATESMNGISVTLVDYLCYALQTPYFDERIPFEEDADKQKDLLSEFGFSEGEYTTIAFSYVGEDKKSVTRVIKLGERNITGAGFYFTVTDNGVERPYIYSSISNYFEYALSNMTEFVKPLIIAPGLSVNKGQEPYYTTGYYQWLNEVHDGKRCERDEKCALDGKCNTPICTCDGSCTFTTAIPNDETRVVTFVDTVSSSIISGDAKYESFDEESLEIDIGEFKRMLKKYLDAGVSFSYEKASYERIIKSLVGKSLGEGGFSVTLASPKSIIDFSKNDSVSYHYVITSVEAIITDSTDITTPGISVGDNNLIKVTYTAKVGDKELISKPAHAVIDLGSVGLDAETVSKIRNAAIGESLSIAFSVDYTADNALKKSSKYVITEIIDIYDEEDKRVSNIDERSTVGYRYEVWVDGVYLGTATYWLDLSKIENGSEDMKIKKALKGKTVGAVNLEFDDHNAYYEYFLSFTTYKINEIRYFITSELVSAFRFQNYSDRDPYYGESIYENLMEDEHRLYGLNSGVCDTLVKVLGGASEDSTTGTGIGLVGDKVIEMGLTPEVLEKYKLYAHTIYFELPRSILSKPRQEGETADSNNPEDLIFGEELGFTLYISEVDPETNMRYIASDLYDIVTRVPAEDFAFLNYDFESFWARRNLIMVDVAHIDYLGVEFHASDYKGNYKFDVIQHSSTNRVGVVATVFGDEITKNKFTEFISDPDYSDYVNLMGGVNLNDFYKFESGVVTSKPSELETLGESSFRDVMHMLYYVTYVNLLSDEEREEAPSEDDLVMRMYLKLDPDAAPKSQDLYVYNFYRIDDRRVRVSLHREDSDGDIRVSAVSDFYISPLAYKKIAKGFISLLNAELIDINDGYPD